MADPIYYRTHFFHRLSAGSKVDYRLMGGHSPNDCSGLR